MEKMFHGANGTSPYAGEAAKGPLLQFPGVLTASCPKWLAGASDPRSGWSQKLMGVIVRVFHGFPSGIQCCLCQGRIGGALDPAHGLKFGAKM